jgi:N6-adenosine-specific RNA methylase IME4
MTKPFSDKKYQIIYSDPPWHYNDKRNKHTRLCGGAMVHYPVMKTKEICELPVKNITEENAVLFLWATWPNLLEAIKVIKAWGFTYKTIGFIWIKTNKRNGKPFFGIGYYTKSNSEPCLLAVKGETIKPATNSISSVIISPRQKHSKKPNEIRKKIDELYPTQKKIELFARKENNLFNEFKNWDTWGNEC